MKALYLLLTILFFSRVTQAQQEVQPYIGAGFQINHEKFYPEINTGFDKKLLSVSLGISTFSVNPHLGINFPYGRVTGGIRIPYLGSPITGQALLLLRIPMGNLELAPGIGIEIEKKPSVLFQLRLVYKFIKKKDKLLENKDK